MIDPSKLRIRRSISDVTAMEMATYVREHFREKFIGKQPRRGAFIVLDPAGEVLVQTPMGDWQPRHNATAHKKARTALFLQANTGPLEQKIRNGHGKDIETTFEGGVALFALDDCSPESFVGVAAFSGVPDSKKDVELVVEAANSVRLFAQS
ncbi:MAG: heme-binding protein [bacterium]|nr:heme-binding protein [bacterium]